MQEQSPDGVKKLIAGIKALLEDLQNGIMNSMDGLIVIRVDEMEVVVTILTTLVQQVETGINEVPTVHE